MDTDWDVIIVGGGPAGLSSALTLGRARRSVLVIDAGQPRNRFASHMHTALGHEGLDPAELLRRGRDEVAAYDVTVREDSVVRVDDHDHGLSVHLTSGTHLRARALVVATGLTDELPDVPGLADHWGSSVLHCPYCHGWEVRDRRIGVLTTSPLGMHHALLLRQWTDDLVVFTAGLGPLSPDARDRLVSRGIELVDSPVTEMVTDDGVLTGALTAAGDVVRVDAIFTAGVARPHDTFLAHLGLERAENPMGSFLAVDETGRTSHARIFAVGNVTNPGANVPLSVGQGTMAGAMVNMMLVNEDFDRAKHRDATPEAEPFDFWEQRYADRDQLWSGRVNKVLSDIAPTLTPGRALDLGCGEGGDALWLAQQGWQTTGIDISPSAIARGQQAASEAGLTEEQVRLVAADLAELDDPGPYDLVTASFFHSPVELPRVDILRRAASLVAPGGHLLITSHAAPPSWAEPSGHEHLLKKPAEELAELDLGEGWTVVVAEVREREVTRPDGQQGMLEDGVSLLRRHA